MHVVLGYHFVVSKEWIITESESAKWNFQIVQEGWAKTLSIPIHIVM